MSDVTAAAELAKLGILGIMLGWFMFRIEKKFSAIDDLSRTILLDILSRPVEERVRDEATRILETVNLRSREGFKIVR